MYTSPYKSNSAPQDGAVAAAKVSNDDIHHLHGDSLSHGTIFNLCFLHHINGDKCEGKADIVSTAGDTKGNTTGKSVSALTAKTGVPFLNEIELILNKPAVKISIPGLSFSNITKTQDGDGTTYLLVPFLGEYIGAVYKYIVIIAGIIATVMLIFAGVQWMMPGNVFTKDDKSINQAKNRIQKAVVGLILILTSYTILYTINPELVQFRNLRVQYIAEQEFKNESIERAEESIPTKSSVSVPGVSGSSPEAIKQNVKLYASPFADNSWCNVKNPSSQKTAGIDINYDYFGSLDCNKNESTRPASQIQAIILLQREIKKYLIIVTHTIDSI